MKSQVNVTQALLVLVGSIMITACGPAGFSSNVGVSKSQDGSTGKNAGSTNSTSGAEVSTSSPSSSSSSSFSEPTLRADETPKCADIAAEINRITPIIAAYYASELAYNKFWKAMAHAGGAPRDYVSFNVSPALRQGPGITDMLDGVTLLRSDLYYASDAVATVRQALREFRSPTLDPIYLGKSLVEQTYRDYVLKFQALPKFAGPAGMQVVGSPQRTMTMQDAHALEALLAQLNSRTCTGAAD